MRSNHQLNKTMEYLSACSSSGNNTFARAEERQVGCQSYPKDGPHVTWQMQEEGENGKTENLYNISPEFGVEAFFLAFQQSCGRSTVSNRN